MINQLTKYSIKNPKAEYSGRQPNIGAGLVVLAKLLYFTITICPLSSESLFVDSQKSFHVPLAMYNFDSTPKKFIFQVADHSLVFANDRDTKPSTQQSLPEICKEFHCANRLLQKSQVSNCYFIFCWLTRYHFHYQYPSQI